jgi:hypothetical protein
MNLGYEITVTGGGAGPLLPCAFTIGLMAVVFTLLSLM